MNTSQVARLSFAAAFVAIFAYVLLAAQFGFGQDFPRAALFPMVIGGVSILLALGALVQEARAVRAEAGATPATQARAEAVDEIEAEVERRRTIAIAAWIVFFFLAIWLLGFPLGAPVATFLYLWLGARERLPVAVVLAAVAWAFIYGVFDRLIHVPFPEGLVFERIDTLGGGV